MPGDGDHHRPTGNYEGARMHAMGRGGTDRAFSVDERGVGRQAETGRAPPEGAREPSGNGRECEDAADASRSER
eukprot:5433676-Prymnesium_polylepis.1